MMNFEITSYSALKEALGKICAELEGKCVSAETVFSCKLALNELVVNALRYGGGRAYVVGRESEEGLMFCVRGEREFRPPEHVECPASDSEGGRGLFLVDAVCDARDYTEPDGVRIFFTLRK